MTRTIVIMGLFGTLAACSAKPIFVVPVPAGVVKFHDAAVKAFTDASGIGSSAICETPKAVDIGTAFKCTGTGADGTKFDLVATIDKADHVLVNSAGSSS